MCVLFAQYDLKDGVRARRVSVGGRCAGSAQNVAALDEPRDVVDVGDGLLLQSDHLHSLTAVLHHTQLRLVAEQVKHLQRTGHRHRQFHYLTMVTDMSGNGPCVPCTQMTHPREWRDASPTSSPPLLHEDHFKVITNRVSRDGKAIDSIRLSVRLSVCLFPSIFWTDWTLNLSFLCVCVMTIARLKLKVKVIGQGQMLMSSAYGRGKW